MTNMQVAIGLWRETGNYLFNGPSFKIRIDHLLNKVSGFFSIGHGNSSGWQNKPPIIASSCSAINKKP
jgi:hypothetical protein